MFRFIMLKCFFLASSNATPLSVRYNEQFSLSSACLLYLFIRQQLSDRGTITSNTARGLAPFRLIEPISSIDDFGTFQYDHWRGLFDLQLFPHTKATAFPPRWRLADNARIFCDIRDHGTMGIVTSSSNGDRPRTASLDVFVRDVCIHENNGQGNAWLDALRKEDILTYEHLSNLRQSEWDNIQKLPMNARKILKAAIDGERESAASDRRQRVAYDSDSEDEDNPLQKNTSKHTDLFRKTQYPIIYLT